MKRIGIITVSALLVCTLALWASTAMAGKPSQDNVFNGNGFPSGPHYNMNIIAKKADFTCHEQEYYLLCPDQQTLVKDCSECPGYDGTTNCTVTDIPIYGGVIFVPQEPGNDKITILMESGKKGPKGNPDATTLEVTDWCTETFDGDGASFRLPKNDQGYAVYARVTGDPKQNPQYSFTNPRLKYVMDESGNDLLLLGFVTNSVFDSNGEQLPSRYDSSGKGKGAQKAVDVSPLFMWSGTICYIGDNYLDYCGDVNGNGVIDEGEVVCAEYDYCCLDTDGDGDYEHCDPLNFGDVCPIDPVLLDLCCVDTDLENQGPEYCSLLEGDVCPEYYDYYGELIPYESVSDYFTYHTVSAWCTSYQSKWVFNIADYVGLLWDIESDKPNTGSSVIQIRFYPLPLNTK